MVVSWLFFPLPWLLALTDTSLPLCPLSAKDRSHLSTPYYPTDLIITTVIYHIYDMYGMICPGLPESCFFVCTGLRRCDVCLRQYIPFIYLTSYLSYSCFILFFFYLGARFLSDGYVSVCARVMT